MDLKKLQNGSDIRGIGSEGIEGEHINLTDEAVAAIGGAFAVWMREKTGKSGLKIAVGRDSRISGDRIKAGVCEALVAAGCDVYDTALASTPAMFMATVTPGYMYDGAIMITASHLPFNKNGLKFFTAEGGLEHEDISRIIELAEAGAAPAAQKRGTVHTIDFMSAYAKGLRDKIISAVGSEKPLSGMKIIVDAGNGSGGFYARDVLAPLGADTAGSQFLEPDGMFPNHIPNPENKDAMASAIGAVKRAGAELGILFDTDVDRVGAVDGEGKVINRNRLIALISAILLEETPGTTIVTDSVTSDGLAKFISQKGGIHHRFKRGYKNVINESKRLNDAGQDSRLAIETSGHAALAENYFLDDGAYLITKIIIKMAMMKRDGKNIFDLIDTLEEPLEAQEFRLRIEAEDFRAYGQRMIEDLKRFAAKEQGLTMAKDNYEGVRVAADRSAGNGWFLVRLSLHEPIIPVNIESGEKGGVPKMARALTSFFKTYDKIDISLIADYAAKNQ